MGWLYTPTKDSMRGFLLMVENKKR